MSDEADALVAHRYRVRSLRDLAPYAKNSRKHSPAQVKLLENSLIEYGWVRPVAEADGTIYAGHGIVMAALAIARRGGCPRDWPDAWLAPTVDISHLSDDQRRAYVIVDNRSSDKSSFDEETLAEELGILSDIGLDLETIGFSEKDLSRLLDGDPTDPTLPELTPKHKLAAHSCPNCGHQWVDDDDD